MVLGYLTHVKALALFSILLFYFYSTVFFHFTEQINDDDDDDLRSISAVLGTF